MRATLPLKRITLLFDYGETILLNRTNTFDTNYNTFNARESNEQAERINLRYKIIIVSIEQWKKKKKRKKKEKREEVENLLSNINETCLVYLLQVNLGVCTNSNTCAPVRAPASHPFFWHFNPLLRQISPFFLFFFTHLSAIKLIGQLTYNLVEFVITLTNRDTEEEARVSFFNPWIITMYRGVSGKCILFSLLFQI